MPPTKRTPSDDSPHGAGLLGAPAGAVFVDDIEVQEPGFDLPGSKFAKVFRVSTAGRRMALCGVLELPAGPENIAERWGGGEFRVFLYGINGERLGTKSVTIEGAPIQQSWSPQAMQASVPPAGYTPTYTPAPVPQPAQNGTGEVAALRAELAALAARLAAPPPPPVPPQMPLAQVLEMARMLKELVGGQSFEPTELSKWHRAGFDVGFEAGQRSASGSDGTDWPAVIGENIPKLVEALGNVKVQQAPRVAVEPRRPAPVARLERAPAPSVVQHAPPAPEPGATTQANPLPTWIARVVAELHRASIAQDAPEYTAAFLERNIPSEALNRLRSVLPSVAVGEVMAVVGNFPRAKVSPDFVTQVVLALQAAAPAAPPEVPEVPATPGPVVTLETPKAQGDDDLEDDGLEDEDSDDDDSLDDDDDDSDDDDLDDDDSLDDGDDDDDSEDLQHAAAPTAQG